MSANIMRRRRSTRSATAPDTNENISHGSRVAMVTPAISTASRVSDAASSGKAVRNMPSPVPEMATASQTRRNGDPSELTASIQSNSIQVVGHRDDDGVLAVEQGQFETERALPVQQVLPPAADHELGNQYGDGVVRPTGVELVEEDLHRRDQIAVR